MSEKAARVATARAHASPGVDDIDFGNMISSPPTDASDRPRASGHIPPTAPSSASPGLEMGDALNKAPTSAEAKNNSKKGKLWFSAGSGKLASDAGTAPAETEEKGNKVLITEKSSKKFTGFSRMVRSMTKGNTKGSDRDDSTKLADIPPELEGLEGEFAGAVGLKSADANDPPDMSKSNIAHGKNPNDLDLATEERNVADLAYSNIFRPFSPQDSRHDDSGNITSPSRKVSSVFGSSTALSPDAVSSAPAAVNASAPQFMDQVSPGGPQAADSDEENVGKFDDADD